MHMLRILMTQILDIIKITEKLVKCGILELWDLRIGKDLGDNLIQSLNFADENKVQRGLHIS